MGRGSRLSALKAVAAPKAVAALKVLAAPSVLAGLATGCTATYTQLPGGGFGPPAVVLSTPGGSYPLYAPPPPPPTERGLAVPPLLSDGGIPPAPAGGTADGVYDGTANLLQNDFGTCAFRFAMTNLRVVRGQVSFSSFRGRIGPDGGVRMAHGSLNWIVGHFDAGHFSGTYTNRYCTYALSLDRVAP